MIDTLLPPPAHICQGKQSKVTSKAEMTPKSEGVAKVTRQNRIMVYSYVQYTLEFTETNLPDGKQ